MPNINKNLYKTVINLLEDYHFETQFKIVSYKMTYGKSDFVVKEELGNAS